jgi:hypothetical protein
LQDAAAAKTVTEVASDKEQAGERERVRVDDPLERLRGRVELPADRRQRDVDDRVVHNDEQDAEAEHRQDPPPAVVTRGLHEGDLPGVTMDRSV